MMVEQRLGESDADFQARKKRVMAQSRGGKELANIRMFGGGGVGTPLKVLEPAYLSLEFDGTNSITLNASNTDTYAVTNLPSWCTLNPSTGVITATGDGTLLGQEFFDVVLTNVDGSSTISNGLRISLTPSNAKFDIMASVLPSSSSELINEAGKTITHTTPKFLGETGGLNSFLNVYYTAYGQNTQVSVVNSSGVEVYNESVVFENDNFHLTPYVYVGSGVTYIPHPSTGGAIRFSKFDTTTDTMTADTIALDAQHLNPASAFTMALGLDGRCYTFASQDGSQTLSSVIGLDVIGGTSEAWKNIVTDFSISRGGADLTHVYFSTNRYGDGSIFSIRLSDGLVTDITGAETAKFEVNQRKNGVVLRVVTGAVTTWRYLYNGTMSADVADLNANPPWGADATDLYSASYVIDQITPPSSFDQSALKPVDGNTFGRLWYRYNESSNYVSVDVPNITTHPATLNRIGIKRDGNIIVSHSGYNGFTEVNVSDDSIRHSYIATATDEAVISPYTITSKSNRVVFSGYYGSPMYELDTSKAWDNRLVSTYNPNTQGAYLNPKYNGNVGSATNVSKAFSSVIDKYNNWWACGEKIRSGEGGGVIYWDGAAINSVSSLLAYEGRCIAANNDYIAVTSLLDAGSVTISLIDIDTKLVVREIIPDILLTSFAGRIVLDADNVYMITSNDAETETRLYKFLLSDGSQVASNTYSFKTEIGGTDDSLGGDITIGEDGYLYAIFKTAADKTLVRIDTVNLQAEPIQQFSYGSGINRFVLDNNTLYTYDANNIRKVSNYSLQSGFVSQIDPNEPILYLDGVNQFIELGNTVTSANQIANGYTYFFTVNTSEDLTSYLLALQLSEIAVYTGYNYGMVFNNNITGTIRDGSVIPNVLYRCALTYDPVTFTTKLYVNGVEAISDTHTGTPFTTGTKWRMTIGARNDNGTTSLYYKGKIGQIQEWNTTFTPTQVLYDYNNRDTALYENGGIPTTDNPLVDIADCISWLPLDEGTGTVVNEKINNVTYAITNANAGNWA